MQRLRRCRAACLEAGYEWVEMHFAHGYLGSEFFSPLANQRTDAVWRQPGKPHTIPP